MKGLFHMQKLIVNYNKTLKLTNVVITKLNTNIDEDPGITIEQMCNYIRSKGFQPLGPHIQYNGFANNNADDMDVDIKLMRQASGFIRNIEKPYFMEPSMRIPNCLYIRYYGPISKIGFAYNKLMLAAFEEDIPLKGSSYSVFIDETNDQVTVDIFMERAD
jgi:effector-binding domain-containing protein